MKTHFSTVIALALASGFAAVDLRAQESTAIEQLRAQLVQLQESFARTMREQQAQIDSLNAQIARLAGGPPSASPGDSAAASRPIAPPPGGGTAYMNVGFDTVISAGGSTAKNPAAFLELGDHDPAKRGFSVRNAEISLDGAVDPYFKGFANIVLKLSPENESEIELEETYIQTTALPANLQVKAGQFFANFGRQNTQHPHAWAFVDQPLILNRVLGPEGLRNIGVQANWLAPTPFYTELSVGAFDGEGGTAFNFRNPGDDDGFGTNRFRGRPTIARPLRGPRDLTYVPRIASSFDLTDTSTVLLGASAALGPNSLGTDTETRIYGTDVYWKWKPANSAAGFPFVSWQAEAAVSRIEAADDPAAATPLPAETIKDTGFYSQLLWGFAPRWVGGLRVDYVTGNEAADDPNDVFRNRRTRFSPSLTFYPTEFSKIRFQYNHDRGETFGTAHSWWLQMEYMLGAHASHKF